MKLNSMQYVVLLRLHSLHIEAQDAGLLSELNLSQDVLDVTARAIRDFLSQPTDSDCGLINETEGIYDIPLPLPVAVLPSQKLWEIHYITRNGKECRSSIRKPTKNQAEHHARSVWGAIDILSAKEV